jgi:transposase-like protein
VTKRIPRDPIYRGCRFSAETIELCVRWYITYRLSYRDLAAILTEFVKGSTRCNVGMMKGLLRYKELWDAALKRRRRPFAETLRR